MKSFWDVFFFATWMKVYLTVVSVFWPTMNKMSKKEKQDEKSKEELTQRWRRDKHYSPCFLVNPFSRPPGQCHLGQCCLGQMQFRPMLVRPMLVRPMLVGPMLHRPVVTLARLLRPIISIIKKKKL